MKSTIVIFASVLFAGCFSQRTAEGLAEGELSTSASLGQAAVRYGITNNVEVRMSYVDFVSNQPVRSVDVFIHSHSIDKSINYGIFGGPILSQNVETEYYYGVTVSRSIFEFFTPYATYVGTSNTDHHYGYGPYRNYLSIGSEISIPLNKSIALNLYPEIVYFRTNLFNPTFGSLNLGLEFGLY